MPRSAPIRHTVSIAGRVNDRGSGLPIAGAVLELVAGPPAFLSTVAVRSRDPLWVRRKERLNRTVSRADGLFYFLDLPDGGPYRIEVTVPHRSARYGRQRHKEEIDVPPAPQSPADPIQHRWVDVVLTSTGVSGRVVTMSNGAKEPVAQAEVSIQDGSTKTGEDGAFTIDGLTGPRAEARFAVPKARLSATAKGFAVQHREIDLKVGAITENVEIILNAA